VNLGHIKEIIDASDHKLAAFISNSDSATPTEKAIYQKIVSGKG
jgi:hypothetical protein